MAGWLPPCNHRSSICRRCSTYSCDWASERAALRDPYYFSLGLQALFDLSLLVKKHLLVHFWGIILYIRGQYLIHIKDERRGIPFAVAVEGGEALGHNLSIPKLRGDCTYPAWDRARWKPVAYNKCLGGGS